MIKNGHTDEALSFTQKLTESIAVEMSAINTNHPVVNAVLNQKYRSMQERHIAVILKVGDLQEICLEEEEIVILLSNLLDNAIRESEKVLKNTGKAVIHLKLECEDHKLIFAVRNPVTEKVEIENDTIKSKRGDHHGIGSVSYTHLDVYKRQRQEEMKRYDRKMFMENSVDSAQALAYNNIKAESLLRK